DADEKKADVGFLDLGVNVAETLNKRDVDRRQADTCEAFVWNCGRTSRSAPARPALGSGSLRSESGKGSGRHQRSALALGRLQGARVEHCAQQRIRLGSRRQACHETA